MKLAMYDYEGYKITVRPRDEEGLSAQVDVFDPRGTAGPAVYKTASLDCAMKWVDAYRAGVIWATLERNTEAR